MDPSHRILLLLVALLCATGSSEACTQIFPDSETSVFLEVGRSFTATCRLQEGSAYTVDDIEWILGNVSIDRQYYNKINASSVSVTLDLSRNMKGWLYCNTTKKQWPPTTGCRYGIYGIFLDVGYPPLKPENLTCIAVQDGKDISPDLTCSWDAGSRDLGLDTSYTLHAVVPPNNYSSSCGLGSSSCTVNLELFPYHYYVSVWVEAKNGLGSVRSEELFNPVTFAKPNPPEDIQVLAEANFSTSLLVTWKSPIDKDKMKLLYAIRYCPADASVWTEVPESFTQAHTGSFRLQPLTPYTEYVVQMRCVEHQHLSYWSDWSANATARTAEAEPKTAPDLWRIISSDHRNVTLVWKPPVEANGKIIKYDLEISEDLKPVKTHFVKEGDIIREHWMELKPGNMANIEITATNSVGKSPKATLFIPRSDQELPGVTRLRCRVRDEELEVEWDGVPPLSSAVHLSGFLLEWVNVQDSGVEPRWQRVGHSANTSTLTGFASMKRYNVSVYPMYKYHSQRVNRIQAGAAKTLAVYIQQGPPDEGPVVSVNESKKNSAQLTWKEVPLASRNGFITNYTIFYRAGSAAHWQSVTVRDNIRSYVLTDLASETDYVVRVMASTVAGSKNGSNFNFKTPKYGDGEVEVIVVVVCLSFLFLTVFIIMFCLQKREVIKQLLWPQVPDPSDSSIAHWSPDFPLKTDMPKEEVSVVEVDAFDGKSLFEEDKAVLPLKKDKYLSEEHSSGIGGSSCMSSPRHSVSDSDESDSGQTTASTVQYSSVVASGYKGQTPNHQPPAFARSESTQPLLDCEEHPDLLSESGGHSRNSYFRRGRELEPAVFTQECDAQNAISLAFSPVQEEETSPIVEDPPASSVSYMPQQSGYRPQ